MSISLPMIGGVFAADALLCLLPVNHCECIRWKEMALVWAKIACFALSHWITLQTTWLFCWRVSWKRGLEGCSCNTAWLEEQPDYIQWCPSGEFTFGQNNLNPNLTNAIENQRLRYPMPDPRPWVHLICGQNWGLVSPLRYFDAPVFKLYLHHLSQLSKLAVWQPGTKWPLLQLSQFKCKEYSHGCKRDVARQDRDAHTTRRDV